MRQRKKIGIFVYVLSDYLMAVLAWTLFFLYRKTVVEDFYFDFSLLNDQNYFKGIIILPLLWLTFYFLVGTYTDIYRKSRLAELSKTFIVAVIGVVLIFFIVLLDDYVKSYHNYTQSVLVLFGLHFGLTAFARLMWMSITKRQLSSGAVGYRTLLIGGNNKALKIYKDISKKDYSQGYNFIGFIATNGHKVWELEKHIPQLGHIVNIQDTIERERIDEVIIAMDSSDHYKVSEIINLVSDKEGILIKIIPDLYDILSGSVKMDNVLGEVLIEIYPDLMPVWQRKFKRLFDIVVSAVVLLVLSPAFLYIAIRVRFSSPGPVFYRQERIGKNKKPFQIIKYRSMFVDSEKDGPALSSDNDPRMTKWGSLMRKWRLDEFPQFWNVLKGEMSLVGPRPERAYYINKIMEVAPEYKYLHKVKPGITSLGMVKFGYAENVREMAERLKYDLLYIENMSLGIDFKILFYTVLTILQGKGK